MQYLINAGVIHIITQKNSLPYLNLSPHSANKSICMYSICSLQLQDLFSSPVPGGPQAETSAYAPEFLHSELGAPQDTCLHRPVQQILTTQGLVHMQIAWACFQKVVFAVHVPWSWYIHPESACTSVMLIRTNLAKT